MGKDSDRVKSRLREILGILLICFSIFLLVALLTHNPEDWPNSSRRGYPSSNMAGPLGAWLSFALLASLGYSGYALLALLIIIAIVLFLHTTARVIVKPAAILVTFILFAPPLVTQVSDALTGNNTLATPDFTYGGFIGWYITDLMITYLGRVGAYLAPIAVILIVVVLTTSLKPSTAVEAVLTLFGGRRGDAKREKRIAGGDVPEPEEGLDGDLEEEGVMDNNEDPFLTPVEEEPERPPPRIQPTIISARNPDLHPEIARGPMKSPLHRASIRPEPAPVEYVFPGPGILDESQNDIPSESREEMLERAQRIVESLRYFNIESEVRQITPGPIITRYELTLAPGVKVGRVVNLSDDLAMALKSKGGIRILAPIPGKAAIGIEVPNKTRSMVYLREVVESEAFVESDQPLLMGIGKNTSGDQIVADLEKMPHLLIAGSTGSGKSVCIHSLIASILMKAHPHRVKMIMVDPKVVELSVYNAIPHLLTPVITDPKRAANALKWAVREMESRYRQLASLGVRDIGQYNRKVHSLAESAQEGKKGEIPKLLPFIIIIIDEFADLMVVASNEIEEYIARLAQMSRAVGIHLVLATQRPSADVITGLIKANFPSRIAFKVMQAANSRIILDQNGADKLLGMGDMLFLQAGKPEPVRLHGAYISSEESQRLVDFVARQNIEKTEIIAEDMFEEESEDEENSLGMRDPNARDSLFFDAARLVVRHNQGSVSLLQRRLKIGYARAARLIDQLEMAAIVSPYDGSKAREVLVDEEYIDQLENEGL
ncbi:MAG: DNA translocase FtsK [Candidatus Latescibacter sp.]|nr:DNA translocase FtsK [Candidatus Latescibacter sp.]